MGACRLQQNRLAVVMFDKLEHNSQVITGGAGPRSFQPAFQLMRFQPGIQSVCG